MSSSSKICNLLKRKLKTLLYSRTNKCPNIVFSVIMKKSNNNKIIKYYILLLFLLCMCIYNCITHSRHCRLVVVCVCVCILKSLK